MPDYVKKYDLRIVRTNKALLEALPKLLISRKFEKLTVNDICEQAQLSRTAFYAHFHDKYDLLEYWLSNVKGNLISGNFEYTQTEKIINRFVRENTKIITNLLVDANNETISLINDFMFQLLDFPLEKDKDGKLTRKYIVMSNFCSGGLVNWLLWQIKHDFPQDFQMINRYIYDIIETMKTIS